MTPCEATLLWALITTLTTLHFWRKAHEQGESRADAEHECDALRQELELARMALTDALDAETPPLKSGPVEA